MGISGEFTTTVQSVFKHTLVVSVYLSWEFRLPVLFFTGTISNIKLSVSTVTLVF